MTRKLLVFFTLFIFATYLGTSQSKIDSLKIVLKTTTDSVAQLEILDDLTKALVRNNSNEQEGYLNQYLSLSKSLGKYDLMASKSRFLLMLYANRSEPNKLLEVSDSLLTLKKHFKKESSEAHILLKRALAYYDLGKFNKAIKNYDTAAQLFMKSGDSIFAADAYLYGGQVKSDANHFLAALEGYKQASLLYKKLGDDSYALLAGNNLSVLYNRNGLTEKGISEREALLKEALAQKDYRNYMSLSFQNASSYFKLQQYQKQKEVIKKMDYYKDSLTLESSRKFNDFGLTFHKATFYIKTDNLKEAEKYVFTLDEKAHKTRSPQYTEEAVLYAKALYFEAKNDVKALQPILEKIIQRKSISQINVLQYAQKELAELCEKEGNFKKASLLRQSNIKLNDSIFNSQRTNSLLYYQTKFETEQKKRKLLLQDAKIKQLEVEQRLTKNKRNTLIVGIVLFFVIAIVFIYYRNHQKIREQAYQNILLNNKVATKTEEVNELLTETVQHIKSKERIAKSLQKVVDKNGDVNIKSIIADLNANKSDDAKLLLVKNNIEKVNYDFIKRLKTEFPELSKTDIEICSFIKIGLNRTQIAQFRNTSIAAVSKSRYRIRKKIGVSDEINLEDFLLKF
ncbi:tetratricopeptide repeat protein [Tenacibaculum agarivorans]|uniref:tetratricopeptide repeat protein n=1 Tax=Tenacibaculum agarivorans TaxID=1908389 RepID=UPI00094B924E|nr:hypothetical protein [Tenacibaculum agarivorans]